CSARPTGRRCWATATSLLSKARPTQSPFEFLRTPSSFPASMDLKHLDDTPAFITKDDSEIRELLSHRNSGIRNQSLAEARLPVGAATMEHYHARTEEIYYLTHGSGRIRVDGELREVRAGDAIAIPPGKK